MRGRYFHVMSIVIVGGDSTALLLRKTKLLFTEDFLRQAFGSH
jgi:hypothetical protein